MYKYVDPTGVGVPILSWCNEPEMDAWVQAMNVSRMPNIFQHFAWMADGHLGYGMPIGGVAALKGAVCPNMVGVDIGCGMGAIQTDIPVEKMTREIRDKIVNIAHRRIPTGEGHSHKEEQIWIELGDFLLDVNPPWTDDHGSRLDAMNLGTLGGGNHFIEIQVSDAGMIWIMLHSGSRNMGQRVARYYHQLAKDLCKKWHTLLAVDDLAFLPVDTKEGQDYIRDMNFALKYAQESRDRMMKAMTYIVMDVIGSFNVTQTVNIHHNYAAQEYHMGHNVWVHRKGATSAKLGEVGIIPGACGNDSASYIVRGKGNPLSFMSCSHGAGRAMGRNDANNRLKKEDCDQSMNGISFRGWQKPKARGKKKPTAEWDLAEASGAYKSIDSVMAAQSDLVDILVKLRPLASIKG